MLSRLLRRTWILVVNGLDVLQSDPVPSFFLVTLQAGQCSLSDFKELWKSRGFSFIHEGCPKNVNPRRYQQILYSISLGKVMSWNQKTHARLRGRCFFGLSASGTLLDGTLFSHNNVVFGVEHFTRLTIVDQTYLAPAVSRRGRNIKLSQSQVFLLAAFHAGFLQQYRLCRRKADAEQQQRQRQNDGQDFQGSRQQGGRGSTPGKGAAQRQVAFSADAGGLQRQEDAETVQSATVPQSTASAAAAAIYCIYCLYYTQHCSPLTLIYFSPGTQPPQGPPTRLCLSEGIDDVTRGALGEASLDVYMQDWMLARHVALVSPNQGLHYTSACCLLVRWTCRGSGRSGAVCC